MTWLRFKATADIPFPPLELRRLVGPIEEKFFDNPSGDPVFPEFPPEMYSFVLDLGVAAVASHVSSCNSASLRRNTSGWIFIAA